MEIFPSISELAALYFNVSEMEAITYLIGLSLGGAECYLDMGTFKFGDNERFSKQSV
jgi:hypothetical protein